MERIYAENDNVMLTMREDDMLLDAKFFWGEEHEKLDARRLFPRTGAHRYISLQDEDGKEISIIRKEEGLMDETAAALDKLMEHNYFIPIIERILEIHEKNDIIHVEAQTDHGFCKFDISDARHNIKILFDGRVLIRDMNDNRYEIPDIAKMDKKSKDELLI